MISARLRWIGLALMSVVMTACATVDFSQAPQATIDNAAYSLARASLRDAQARLLADLRAAALLPAEDSNAAAQALSLLVHGWEGNPDTAAPEDTYLVAVRTKASERRVTIASLLADDLERIARNARLVAARADGMIELEDLPDNLMADIASVEKAMTASRKALGTSDRVVAMHYPDGVVPLQINSARQVAQAVIGELAARADALERRQDAMRPAGQALG
jgi:hypothetical protein